MKFILLGLIAVREAAAIRLPGNVKECDKTCLQEAAGITSSLSTVPHRHLSQQERQEFERDGVVVLRSVVTNRPLLKQLEQQIWRVADADLPVGHPQRQKAESWNAAVRALVYDDLLASIASSAVPEFPDPTDMAYGEAPVWGFHGTPDGTVRPNPNGYHVDDPHPSSETHKGHEDLMVTLWLAVTDGAYPLEFVKGSHKLRKEIGSSSCANWFLNNNGDQPMTYALYMKECVVGLVQNATGRSNLAWSTDMRAGDVFVFTGDLLHMGVQHPTPRLAISVRYRTPADPSTPYTAPNMTWVPPGVVPIEQV